MRAFDTELKAGDLLLNNPVIAGGMTRMLPQTFRGASLTNHSLDGWRVEGGQALLGDIDNNTYSLHLSMDIGHHSVTAAYQRVNGNTPFDYIAQGDSVYLDNSQQYSDFNGPNEHSWKLKYAYNFGDLGLPGLTSAVSYISGKTDLTKVDAQSRGYSAWYSADGKHAKHWERDIDLKYVVQGGKAKDLALRLQWAVTRDSEGYSAVDRDVDEYRVIIDYPINVF